MAADGGVTFKEMFLENTHLKDSQHRVKTYISLNTPVVISTLRRFRCPRIEYEHRRCPGEFKQRLSAEDVALRRYKFVPVRYPTEQERQRIRRKRQKQLSSLGAPKILFPSIEPEEKEAEKEEPEKTDESKDGGLSPHQFGEDSVSPLTPEVPRLTSKDLKNLKIVRKWRKKAFEFESNHSSDEEDDSSQVSGEYKEYLNKLNRERVLGTPDFQTDLESSDHSETEQYIDAKGRRRRKKLTKSLKMYYRSCAICRTNPVRSFARQNGKATIDIRHRMLSHRDAKPIAIALVDDKKTSFIDISFNPLGPIGTGSIAQMLSKNNCIVELNLSSTFPERAGLEALLEALRQNKTIRRLFLNDNELMPSDGEVLAQIIMDLPSLLELHVANNSMGFEGTKQIANAIATSKGKLNVLNLRYNNIRTDTAVKLASAITRNKTLRSLDVSWNGFGTDGCKALALALETNSTLKDLDLTCNRLGLKSLGFLVQGLTKNKGLLCVKIAYNPLTTEGSKALMTAVLSNKSSTLTELDLRGIPVDEDFFEIKSKLMDSRTIRIHNDDNILLGTSDLSKEGDGTFLDNYDPVVVMFEFMKKDNLRVMDFFQFFDVRHREKLSKGDLATGFSILLIPYTQHQIDTIMKKLDTNKDGFISIEEMMRGYTKTDKWVKMRRIKASRNKTTDQGLENLWIYLKSLITKRKDENVKKTAMNSQARRSSLLPGGSDSRKGSLLPGLEGDRGSPDSLLSQGGAGGRRGSVTLSSPDGRRSSQSVSQLRRGSLIMSGFNTGKADKMSLLELGRRGSSGSPSGSDRRGSNFMTKERPDMIMEDEDSDH